MTAWISSAWFALALVLAGSCAAAGEPESAFAARIDSFKFQEGVALCSQAFPGMSPALASALQSWTDSHAQEIQRADLAMAQLPESARKSIDDTVAAARTAYRGILDAAGRAGHAKGVCDSMLQELSTGEAPGSADFKRGRASGWYYSVLVKARIDARLCSGAFPDIKSEIDQATLDWQAWDGPSRRSATAFMDTLRIQEPELVDSLLAQVEAFSTQAFEAVSSKDPLLAKENCRRQFNSLGSGAIREKYAEHFSILGAPVDFPPDSSRKPTKEP